MTHREALVRRYVMLVLTPIFEFFVQWESGHDESVEVNQRALIDKVLARYSGEFTGMGCFRLSSIHCVYLFSYSVS